VKVAEMKALYWDMSNLNIGSFMKMPDLLETGPARGVIHTSYHSPCLRSFVTEDRDAWY